MFELLNTFGQREINKQKKIDISEKKTLVRSGWDMIHNPISIKSDKKVDFDDVGSRKLLILMMSDLMCRRA